MADLSLRQVRKSYGSLDILHGIDLDIGSGEFIVFVGPSGCGKSTLLRTIAGLEKAHYGTTFGTVFEKDGKPYSPDFAAIARAYGIDGTKIHSAAEFKPALERAIESGKPFVIDVVMQNEPVPTAGHWNIMDIYSPGRKVHHASVSTAAAK